MVLADDHDTLILKMEELLTDLDRLQLHIVAVHIDVALARLKEIMVSENVPEIIQQN